MERTFISPLRESSKAGHRPHAKQPCSLVDQLCKQEATSQTFGAAGGSLFEASLSSSRCTTEVTDAPQKSQMVPSSEDRGSKPTLLSALPSPGQAIFPSQAALLTVSHCASPSSPSVNPEAQQFFTEMQICVCLPLLKTFPGSGSLKGNTSRSLYHLPSLLPHHPQFLAWSHLGDTSWLPSHLLPHVSYSLVAAHHGILVCLVHSLIPGTRHGARHDSSLREGTQSLAL
jgi:hypothetical protein